jgi:hypothetical protein
LSAVVSSTEEATTKIMESAEAILDADTSDAEAYQQLVNDKVMVIFEALARSRTLPGNASPRSLRHLSISRAVSAASPPLSGPRIPSSPLLKKKISAKSAKKT